jgi:hypothetical protein
MTREHKLTAIQREDGKFYVAGPERPRQYTQIIAGPFKTLNQARREAKRINNNDTKTN